MTNRPDAARDYARAHLDKFLDELFAMLRIPSLSGDPAYAADVRRMAEWLAQHMRSLGLDNVQVMETAGHPVVYGEWLGAGPSRPTVLVYGHYDVQPPDPLDAWASPPFTPDIRDGKLYARGATDSKVNLMSQLKAVEALLAREGALPVNVKFIVEGEEEVASPNLRPFLEANLELLRADVCVISDSSMARIDEPAITHSLRGMTYLEIEVRGPREDLHSGFWGGATHNPAFSLVETVGNLFYTVGLIAVPRFFDSFPARPDSDRDMSS
ncbi:MAG: M20/M25/M40 family metallo-hydrolase, partial [Caldilineaceae bacterium]|nr:M20/M25/M40 family metallo-hydrolase [Caldilineaceae bacterium]